MYKEEEPLGGWTTYKQCLEIRIIEQATDNTIWICRIRTGRSGKWLKYKMGLKKLYYRLIIIIIIIIIIIVFHKKQNVCLVTS